MKHEFIGLQRTHIDVVADAMDNTLDLDTLTHEEEIACVTLRTFFKELLYGATLEEAIKESTCAEAVKEYLKIVQSDSFDQTKPPLTSSL